MFGPHFDSQRWGQNATQSAAMSGTFFSLTSCLGSIDLRLAKVGRRDGSFNCKALGWGHQQNCDLASQKFKHIISQFS